VEPTLIVPLIGPFEAVSVIQVARATAKTFGRRLVLLRAVADRQPHASRAVEESERRELERLVQGLGEDGIAAEAQVRHAKPEMAIAEAVRDFDARAVVRSSVAGHDLAGWLRTTIIDEAAHRLGIPVLAIPPGEVRTPASHSTLRVLIPLDGSAAAESALVHVLRMAGADHLELYLLDVVHVRLGPLGARLPFVPDAKAQRRAMTRYLRDVATTLRARGMVAQTDVVETADTVGRALRDVAQRRAVDAVAIAAHGLSTHDALAPHGLTPDIRACCPVPLLLVPGSAMARDLVSAGPSGRPTIAAAVRP
jgi:nucleotide-binding universal stress UspA family protein